MKLSALFFALTASMATAETAAVTLTDLRLPHHDQTVELAIWHPSDDTVAPQTYADNPVFTGVKAAVGGGIRSGKHPIVVLSHGMGGTHKSQAWLAAGLAKRGAVVVALDHPNTTWHDFDMVDGAKHWTRAQDLSAALDALVEMPSFKDKLDMSRVMATGFSYGGWTALSLGGATSNHTGFVEACEKYIETMSACDILLSEKVNVKALDPEQWNRSYRDARVTHVAAIDPGFVWGHNVKTVSGLLDNTLIIGFGAGDDRMMATDFDKSGLSNLIPSARFKQFVPATHFTAMPLCTEKGEAILRSENDDPVCTDPEGTDRAAIHDKIVEMLARDLGL